MALDKAMQKRLEERTRSHSEAHSFIRMHESKLGKANVEPLEKQADRIALGSYTSHVGLVKKKNELDRLLADASAVDSTLGERIEELKSAPPEEKLSPNEKKAREEELAALEPVETIAGYWRQVGATFAGGTTV